MASAPPPTPVNPFIQLQGMDPSQLTQQAPSLAPNQTMVQQVPGPLGTHSFLGGVLGILGDAALSSMGLPAQYLPRLQNAREADAVSTYPTDPQGSLQKLTAVAGVPTAQAYEDNQSNDALRKAQIAAAQLQSHLSLLKFPAELFAAQQPIVNQYKQLAGTATPQNASAISTLINSRLPGYNIDPGAVGFPTSGDPNDLKAWAQSEMTAEQLAASVAKAQEVAETARHNKQAEETSASEAGSAAVTAGARSTEAGVAAAGAPSSIAERIAMAAQAAQRAKLFGAQADKLAAQRALLPGGGGGTPSVNIIHYDAQGNRIP